MTGGWTPIPAEGRMNLEEKVACELKDLGHSSHSGRNARR